MEKKWRGRTGTEERTGTGTEERTGTGTEERTNENTVHPWMVTNEVWGYALVLFLWEVGLIVHVLPLHLFPCLALLFPSLPLRYFTSHLFLFSTSPFSSLFFDQLCKSQNKVNLECYYEPISKCTIQDALKNASGDAVELKDVYHVGDIVAGEEEKMKKDYESKERRFFICISSIHSHLLRFLIIFMSRIGM